MGKLFGIAIVFVIIVGLAGLATPLSPVLADDPVVTFPDPKLDAAIREAIGKPTGDIYQSDLEGLTNFSASYNRIHDLTGLEYCTNLTTLNFNGNPISDISPLSSLTNLTALHFGGEVVVGFQISDISPLSSLTNLTTLDLSRRSISDISPLNSLTNLTTLDLSYNEVSDISALSSLTNLTTLSLSDNRISDISPLVDNIGIDEGDTVHLLSNCLDITPDSQAMNDIQTLQDRGVSVYYGEEPGAVDSIPTIAGLFMVAGLAIFGMLEPVIYGWVSLFQLSQRSLIIVILAAVAIIGLAIFFFVRSRRRAS